MPSGIERPLLLDTHVGFWMVDGGALTREAELALERAGSTDVGVYLSPISAWEMVLLVSKGRIALSRSPESWLATLRADGVREAKLTSEILVSASFLPGSLHGDPADRILAATARSGGFVLVSRDAKLLAYAAEGHMHALRC